MFRVYACAILALLLFGMAPFLLPVPELEEMLCAYEQTDIMEAAALLPPVGYPVEFDLKYNGPKWGESQWLGDRYIIRIHEDSVGMAALDTLIHEWAHLLVWDATQESPHDDLWAVAYGRCYRAVVDL